MQRKAEGAEKQLKFTFWEQGNTARWAHSVTANKPVLPFNIFCHKLLPSSGNQMSCSIKCFRPVIPFRFLFGSSRQVLVPAQTWLSPSLSFPAVLLESSFSNAVIAWNNYLVEHNHTIVWQDKCNVEHRGNVILNSGHPFCTRTVESYVVFESQSPLDNYLQLMVHCTKQKIKTMPLNPSMQAGRVPGWL